jgi:UDP-N-acetylmuramoylalanine--D-glutamate ligase
MQDANNISNLKRLVILGAGESGVGTAILAVKQGFDVFVSDKGIITEKYKSELITRNIAFEELKHTESLILNADEVVKSPGIPDKVDLIKKLHTQGTPVISEIEFAGRYNNAKTICITGSNGKTTTTLLTYHILKNAGVNVGLGGNIGKSFAWQVAESQHDYYVLELSSFQLDGMYKFRADIAILLNITPDHLDRYEYKMQNYVDSKFRVIQNQTKDDAFIYCIDDDETAKGLVTHTTPAKHYPFSIKQEIAQGAYLHNNNIHIQTNENTFIMSIFELALQGKHNTYNSMASGIAAKILDIRNDNVRESMSDFKNAEHRLEPVLTINGVEFINDSKATNINSTWYALESMQNPVVLILGGVDKGNDYSMLFGLVKDKVKAIVCLGKDNTKIHEAFGEQVII